MLFEAGDTIKAIYFPHTGIVSIVVDLASGEMIETAMIGRDSLVGGSAAIDDDIALNRAVVQVAGVASVVDVGTFRGLVQQSHTFHATLARHRQFILAQAQQSAACNAAHTLEARLSRWLLRCHDLLGSDDIPLTQEFLAEMLGVRRTSVTLVASTLAAGGLHPLSARPYPGDRSWRDCGKAPVSAMRRSKHKGNACWGTQQRVADKQGKISLPGESRLASSSQHVREGRRALNEGQVLTPEPTYAGSKSRTAASL